MTDEKESAHLPVRPYRQGEDYLKYLWETDREHPMIKRFMKFSAEFNRKHLPKHELSPPDWDSRSSELRRMLVQQSIQSAKITIK